MKILLSLMILLKMFIIIRTSTVEDEEYDRPQIEVKAQLLRCTGSSSGDSDKFSNFIGFDKDEELAKSEVNACRNKLVVTMKLYNPKQTLARDEYVTLDHIFDPVTRSKAMLLNPYVIRVMQGTPFLTYDLHFSQVVNGEVTNEVIQKGDPNFPGCQRTITVKPISATNASVPMEYKAEVPPDEDMTEDSVSTQMSHLKTRSVTKLGPICGNEQVMGKPFQTTFCCICNQNDDTAANHTKNNSKSIVSKHNRQIQSYNEDSQEDVLSHGYENDNDEKNMKYENYLPHLWNSEYEFLKPAETVKDFENKPDEKSIPELLSGRNEDKTNASKRKDPNKMVNIKSKDAGFKNVERLKALSVKEGEDNHLHNEGRKIINPEKLFKQRKILKNKNKYFRGFPVKIKDPEDRFFKDDSKNNNDNSQNLDDSVTSKKTTVLAETITSSKYKVNQKLSDRNNMINSNSDKNTNTKPCKNTDAKQGKVQKQMYKTDNDKTYQLLKNDALGEPKEKEKEKTSEINCKSKSGTHLIKKENLKTPEMDINDYAQSYDQVLKTLPEMDYYENDHDDNLHLHNKRVTNKVFPSLLLQKMQIITNKKRIDNQQESKYLIGDSGKEINGMIENPIYEDYYNDHVEEAVKYPEVFKSKLEKAFPKIYRQKVTQAFPKVYQKKPKALKDVENIALDTQNADIHNDNIIDNNDLMTSDKLKFIQLIDHNFKISEDYLGNFNDPNENSNLNNIEHTTYRSSNELNYPLRHIQVSLPNPHTQVTDYLEEESKLIAQRQLPSAGIDCNEDDNNTTFVPSHLTTDQAHCMKFNEIWYTAYTLDPPLLNHKVGLQVFEKRSVQGAPDIWLLVSSFPLHVGPTKPHSTDEDSISMTYTFYPELETSSEHPSNDDLLQINPHHHRLLIPQPVPSTKAVKYPELVGGPEEYLILHESLIGPECGKAGVAFEAFTKAMGLPNDQSQEIQNCLANQPMQLWRQDKKAELCKKPLKYFLKRFGALPKDDAVKGSQASLVRDGPLSYALDGQIRADHNTVVRVGTSARITEALVDGSCALNTVVSIGVTNMGLASAAFQVRVSDCGPGLPYQWGHLEANSTVISPQKAYSFTIRMPGPPESYKKAFYCSVEVLNSHRELLAMRRIRVEPLSRCLCLWHCLCACIASGVIPHAYALRCKEMISEHQHAAGFQGSPPDVMYVTPSSLLFDLLIFTAAVLLILLLMGFTKGLIGLVWSPMVGNWSIDAFGKPRKPLEKYFEHTLQHRSVITDSHGYPIHPDTGKRTVRMYGKCTQFLLNLIFFIVFPFIILFKVCKYIWCCKKVKKLKNKGTGDSAIDDDSEWNKQNEKKWHDEKNDDEMRHLLADDNDPSHTLCEVDCGNRGNCWMTGGACERTHAQLQVVGHVTPVTSYNGTYEEDLVERQIIAQLKRSQETLLEHGMTIRAAGSNTKISPFEKVNHDELNTAQSLVAQMLQARVVFKHCTGSRGNALIPTGVSYCVRGYFLRGLVGITFITPTPLLQHWKLSESGRMEILSPARVLSSTDFTVEYESSLQVLRAAELTLQPTAPCINVRLQDLTT